MTTASRAVATAGAIIAGQATYAAPMVGSTIEDAFASWAGRVILAAATITALGTMWTKVLRPLWRQARRMLALLDRVSAEFGTNGGSTLRDAVNRLERRAERTEDQVLALPDRIAAERDAAIAPVAAQIAELSHRIDRLTQGDPNP